MDHNQTITDLFLQKHLSTEPRIIAAELYEAIKGQLNPQLELAEFRLAIKEWFDGPLSSYFSTKGRFGGIKLRNEDNRIAGENTPKASKPVSNGLNIGLEPDSSEDETDEDDGLIVYITPSMRLYQPDSRNWAIQRRNGEVWVSQYYQNSLDEIIKSFIRRAMNGEFKVSTAKITELKDLVKVIKDVKSSLEESFKAAIVEKTGGKTGEQAA